MDYKVELVTRAFHKSEPEAGLWDNLPAFRKEQLREFARNAIDLLNEDIGVLLLALEQSAADERVKGTKLAAQYLACCSTSCPLGACAFSSVDIRDAAGEGQLMNYCIQ